MKSIGLLIPLFLVWGCLTPLRGLTPSSVSRTPIHSATVQDTIQLSVSDVVQRALGPGLGLGAARASVTAAEAGLRQSAGRANPTLSILTENLGAMEATSGRTGWEGVQGGVELGFPLSISGSRRASIRLASIELDRARSRLGDAERAVAYRATTVLIERDRAEARLLAVAAEVEALESLHNDLIQGIRSGEASPADGAQALLALGQARSERARAESAVAAEHEHLLALLGLPPETPVRLMRGETCPGDGLALESSAAPSTSIPVPLQSDALLRTLREEEITVERTARWPLLTPRIGWRREAGVDALSLGLDWELPVFNRRQAALEQAQAHFSAASEDFREAERQWEAQRAVAQQTFEALARAGETFDSRWHEALAVTVGAAEALFAAGEGSLAIVLQARLARRAALEDAFAWEAEFRMARLALYAADGRLPDNSLFCSPLSEDIRP